MFIRFVVVVVVDAHRHQAGVLLDGVVWLPRIKLDILQYVIASTHLGVDTSTSQLVDESSGPRSFLSSIIPKYLKLQMI